MLYGYYLTNRSGSREWRPNPSIPMSADEQFRHNLKIQPGFAAFEPAPPLARIIIETPRKR